MTIGMARRTRSSIYLHGLTTPNWIKVFVPAADGRLGLNNEKVMLSYSTNGGDSWSSPTAISTAGDRGFHAAAAISPVGQQLYIGYNAFTTPYRTNTSDPRSLVGVVLHADIGTDGTPTDWNCTAAQKAIRAARSTWAPLSFWVITSMLSRQAHTALRCGTTHA